MTGRADDQTYEQSGEVLVEYRGPIVLITISRPHRRNAINLATAHQIAAALADLDRRTELRVGILTGAGGNFSAGLDLVEFANGVRPGVPGLGFAGFVEAPPAAPLIAAVEGWALGGGFEMVLACDLVVAGTSARFGLPEVQRGLAARAGGAFRLPRRLPPAIAMEAILTGEPINADDAQRYGLVNRVVRDGDAVSEAIRLAETIAANAPLAVEASKRVATESADWPIRDCFERQRPVFDPVFASADAQEGARAFTEKRPPRWQRR